jgi:hypothetical protein
MTDKNSPDEQDMGLSGLMYDQNEAAIFISKNANESFADALGFLQQAAWLEAHSRGAEDNEGLGYVEPFTMSPADLSGAIAHIQKKTGMSPPRIARMFAENVGYMVSVGVMDEGAYPYFLGWAESIAQSRDKDEND